MQLQKKLISFFLKAAFVSLAIFALATPAVADGITPQALSAGGAVTRDRQLNEIREVMRGGRGGFIDAGLYYTPSSEQLPLHSQYGEHDGYAFRHHLAGFGSGYVGNNNHVGFLLWFDRSGWDGEDFLFFPQYNDFSLERSVTTWGISYTNTAANMTLAAGMQHQNIEHVGNVYHDESDSLAYSWAHLRWNNVSVQGNLYKSDWRSVRVALDLESRMIYGGRVNGPLTYLPNIDLTIFNNDDDKDLRVTWEQNLFAQRLYAKGIFDVNDKKFHSATLTYYPDPSRMVGFEASCLWRGDDYSDVLIGGAIDLLFVRLSYNSAYDYDNFFGAKGTFLAEIKFSLATIDGFLFGRGASKTAPLETSVLKQKNKDMPPEGGLMQANPMETKTVEAKGVRYENAGGKK